MGISPAAMNYITSLADNATYQELMKRTGINLSFIHFHPDTQAEQFNLICASGDYPDVMNGVVNQYTGGADKGATDGLFIPATGVLDYFTSAFGVGSGMYLDGDTIKYGPLEEGYKEYLQMMSQWYSEGLLYQDAHDDYKA